jgi:protein-tyrosine phosphatase
MKKILFVCTGNICRSTTAEAIARHVAKNMGKGEEYFFDSAGTHGYHVGESADPRAVRLGKERGVSFEGISSRKISKNDFEKFDLIFAMDRGHLRILQNLADETNLKKIQLFLSFSQIKNSWNDEVIDPYYGERGFEEVFDVIEEAVRKIIL